MQYATQKHELSNNSSACYNIISVTVVASTGVDLSKILSGQTKILGGGAKGGKK